MATLISFLKSLGHRSGRAVTGISGKPPALVLGLSETGLAAARSLSSFGVRVFGAAESPGEFGVYSNRVITLRSPMSPSDAPRFVDWLCDWADSQPDKPVLIPTSDRFVLLVTMYAKRCAEHFQYVLPPRSVVENLLDKARFAEVARAGGFLVPWTTLVSKKVATELGDLPYPGVVKPRGGSLRTRSSVPKATRVGDAEELQRFLSRHQPSLNSVIFQCEVAGPDKCHYSVACYLDRRGKVAALFCARKIRQGNMGMGVGTYVESTRCPEAVDLAVGFLQAIGYVGVAEVELKRDVADGRLYLIEVNPRLWSQAELARRCGVDFARLLYSDAIGQPVPRNRSAKRQARWIGICDDLYVCFGAGGPARTGTMRAATWLRQALRADAYELLDVSDPAPFLASARKLAGAASRSAVKRVLRRLCGGARRQVGEAESQPEEKNAAAKQRAARLYELFVSPARNLRRRVRPSSDVTILAYHRVAPDDWQNDGWDDGVVSATATAFAEQLEFLGRQYSFLSLPQLMAAFHGNGALPRQGVLITFDDGYADVYRYAFPVLKERGLPALVFLVTSHVGRQVPYWWDELSYLFKRTLQVSVDLTDFGLLPLDLHTPGHRYRALQRVLVRMKTTSESEHQALLELCRERLKTDLPTSLGGAAPLSWGMVKEMSEHGIEFGSHTATHPVLTKVTEDRLKEELVESRREIEAVLRTPAMALGYPVGAVDSRVRQATVEAGYHLGMTLSNGINNLKSADPFTLKRICIEREHTDAYFRCRVSFPDFWQH